MIILFSALVFGYFLLENAILRQTRIQIEKDNVLLVQELSRALSLPLLENDRLAIEDHLAVFENSKGVVGIFVFDRTGKPEGFLDNGNIGSIESADRKEELQNLPSGKETVPISFSHILQRHLYLLKAPINFKSVNVGTVHIYLSDAPYEKVRTQITRSFLLLGGVSFVVALLGSLWLSVYISRPIRRLRDATRKVGEGTFEPVQTPYLPDETGDLVGAFNEMVAGLKHKELLEKALVRYVSRDVAEHLINHPELVHLGGYRQETVILFADIRNFTTLSDQLPPEEVVQILNDYFNSFIDDIFLYKGSVNNIMGDGIMIVFGIPEYLSRHPDYALECALSMREKITALSMTRELEGKPAVEFGFGLHIGEGVVGHIGSKTRMEYTVVGSPVNIAYRIQENAGAGEILVSDQLLKRCEGHFFRISRSETLQMKGVKKPILVHSIETIAMQKIPSINGENAP